MPARPTPLIDMPLELPPPTAAERKKLEETKAATSRRRRLRRPTRPRAAPKTDAAKSPAPKTDAAKTPAPKAELPVEVIAPGAAATKKK